MTHADVESVVMDSLLRACTVGSDSTWREGAREFRRLLAYRGFGVTPTAVVTAPTPTEEGDEGAVPGCR
jgi:hypothetical protein